jgi:hypothetical protein
VAKNGTKVGHFGNLEKRGSKKGKNVRIYNQLHQYPQLLKSQLQAIPFRKSDKYISRHSTSKILTHQTLLMTAVANSLG